MGRPCPFCAGENAKVVVTIDARSIVDGNATYRADALTTLGVLPDTRYDIVRCTRCNFVYTADLPGDGFLARLYSDVIDARMEADTPHARGWIAHQLQLAASLLSRVAATAEARILDYGCGDGVIVKALDAAGISCLGYEPYARETTDPRFTDSLARVKMAAPFTGIILSDVLEHVPAPMAVLDECYDLLEAGGWIAVSVPDFSRARLDGIVRDLRASRAVTRELNPWEHLNYFSPTSLSAMVERASFRVEMMPADNFGFRPTTTGLRRVTNAIRSAGRIFRFAVSATPGKTTLFAQK